jgi:anti-sigma factor RsiW
MNQELENLITQSLDGLLSPEQQVELDAELARNPAARQLFNEYASLDAALKSTSLPAINFDLMAQRISQAVDESEGPAPIYVFPAWSKWSAGIAAAACVLLAVTIWGHRSVPDQPLPVAITTQTTSVAPAEVAIMDAGEPINNQPIAAVAIGPQPGRDRIDLPAREALTQPRSAVAIDSAAVPAQDTDRPLY